MVNHTPLWRGGGKNWAPDNDSIIAPFIYHTAKITLWLSFLLSRLQICKPIIPPPLLVIQRAIQNKLTHQLLQSATITFYLTLHLLFLKVQLGWKSLVTWNHCLWLESLYGKQGSLASSLLVSLNHTLGPFFKPPFSPPPLHAHTNHALVTYLLLKILTRFCQEVLLLQGYITLDARKTTFQLVQKLLEDTNAIMLHVMAVSIVP